MSTKTRTIEWPGKSGRKYTYGIYRLPPDFEALPGNYIFARETSPGSFRPIYIGETSDLSQRFEDHHKADCIRRNGATHIHVHVNSSGATARRAEEADLLERWTTSCNG